MHKIIIDCRYLGMSGIGRFLENILERLDYSKNQYTLMGPKEKIEKYKNVNYIYDDLSPFSSKALLKTNTSEINKHDIYFSPNFIIPFGIKIKIITVLHDIIFLDMPKINKGYVEYKIKKYLLRRCMKKSAYVLTVSRFSLDRISHFFPKYRDKLDYSYQGIAEIFKNQPKALAKEDYIIFVGNIKKHKGLSTLLDAYELLKQEQSTLKLYIVGDASSFRNSDEAVTKRLDQEGVLFTGRLGDKELISYVSSAKFLICPSFYEGFGLTPLEALYLGTKPIISDIDVFKEVYSNLPVAFFNVGNPQSLKNAIQTTDTEIEFDAEAANQAFSYMNYTHKIEKLFE